MLAALTTTALVRGWPPPVYQRLVSQLRDSSEPSDASEVLDVYKRLLVDRAPNPLLCEYILVLSMDPHSPLFFPSLLSHFSSGNWRERPSSISDLIGYIARGADAWVLPVDADRAAIAQSIAALAQQADEGCAESRTLVVAVSHLLASSGRGDDAEEPGEDVKVGPAASEAATGPVNGSAAPDARGSEHDGLESGAQAGIQADVEASNAEGPSATANSTEAGAESSGAAAQTNGSAGNGSIANGTAGGASSSGSVSTSALLSSQGDIAAPSVVLRLEWLDWQLRTAQPLDFASMRRQIDLMWPGDRVSVVSYELCVTAFDVFAATGSGYAAAFLRRRLPLILQGLATDAGELLDSVISRIFTTMDKEVVEAVEARQRGIRAEFGSACIELGLCDPTVLHTLHRAYTPRPEHEPPKIDQFITTWDLAKFRALGIAEQARLASEVVRIAQGALADHYELDRHALARLCAALHADPIATDELFVHTSVRAFLDVVIAHADAAAQLPDDDGGAALVYSDLGVLLAAADMLAQRYRVRLPDGSWASQFLQRRMFVSASELTPAEQQLMGQWIGALFSGSSGIADELLRPFAELGVVLPALLQQAVRAYWSAVIDRETLKNGLDYFAQQFSASLFAPLLCRVLYADLFEGLHQATTVKCMLYFVSGLLRKRGPDFELAKVCVLPLARKIADDAASGINSAQGTASSQMPKLLAEFAPLLAELAAQISAGEAAATASSPFPLSSGSKQATAGTDASGGRPGPGGDAERISGAAVSGPSPGTTKESASSSIADSLSAMSSQLAGWQARPQGVPPVAAQVLADAKAVMGPSATRRLIEETVLSQSPETVVALLVTDALWVRPGVSVLVDAPVGERHLTRSAREAVAKLEHIVSERDAKAAAQLTEQKEQVARLPPQGPAATTNTPAAAPVEPSPRNEALPEEPPLGTAAAGVESFLVDDTSADPTQDVMAGDALGQNIGQEFGFNDYDNDFVNSQPMDLADLDSAMDFGWD